VRPAASIPAGTVDATYDKITAKSLWIEHDSGNLQAVLGPDYNGGALKTLNGTGENPSDFAPMNSAAELQA
jgi:hypothetical protein